MWIHTVKNKMLILIYKRRLYVFKLKVKVNILFFTV